MSHNRKSKTLLAGITIGTLILAAAFGGLVLPAADQAPATPTAAEDPSHDGDSPTTADDQTSPSTETTEDTSPDLVTSQSHDDVTDPPQNVSAVAGPDVGEIFLDWDEPTIDPSSVDHYKIYRGTVSGNLSFLTNVSAPQTNFTDSGLPDNTTFFYQVSAVNGFGESNKSAEVSATTFSVPSAPQNLSAIGGAKNASLSWDAPADDGGTDVTSYNVYRDGVLVASTNDTAFLDTGLEPGTTYTYEVSAVNDVGEGPLSDPATATTLDAPSELESLAAVPGPERGEIHVKWKSPIDSGDENVTSFNIYRDGVLYVTISPANASGAPLPSEFHFIDDGLSDNETHVYHVAAVSAAGEGVLTGPVQSTTFHRPSAPQDLKATAEFPHVEYSFATGTLTVDSGLGEATLIWEAPDDRGGLPVQEYVVYRGTSPDNLQEIARTDGTEKRYEDSGLDPLETYHYAVSAVNAIGEGPQTDAKCTGPGPWIQSIEDLTGMPCESPI